MSIVAFNDGPVPHPSIYGTLAQGTTAHSPVLMDAAAEKVAHILYAPKAGTLTRVGFRTATVTVGDTLRVSFQGINPATGDPDGVISHFRNVVVGNADDNLWFATGLITTDGTDGGALKTVTRGERLAIVIDYASYVAGNLNIATLSQGLNGNTYVGTVYIDYFTSFWSKLPSITPTLALQYNDGTFPRLGGAAPWNTMAFQTYNNGSTPDEVAMVFTLAAPQRICSAWVCGNFLADADVVLYDGAGTVMGSVLIDKDIRGYGSNPNPHLVHFSSEIDLASGVPYYLTAKPTTGSSIVLAYVGVNAAANFQATDGGEAFHWAERTNGGAWSFNTARRPVMGIFPSGHEAGSVGGQLGGSLFNAGFN